MYLQKKLEYRGLFQASNHILQGKGLVTLIAKKNDVAFLLRNIRLLLRLSSSKKHIDVRINRTHTKKRPTVCQDSAAYALPSLGTLAERR